MTPDICQYLGNLSISKGTQKKLRRLMKNLIGLSTRGIHEKGHHF
jgi:hypothetical protein